MSNESGAVSYPKSGENIGRGIKLMHNGKLKHIHLLLIKYLNIQLHKNTCSLKYPN